MPNKIKLIAAAELPVGENKCVPTPSGDIALFHREDGFFALDNECPHRGGPLSEGFVTNGAVACPWHQWSFKLGDGACTNIPGAKTKTHPVEVIDGDVWIILA